MGKKGKDKKKGKGAEKTALKTEKKLASKHKKELEAIGEDDIEKIVAQIEKEEQKRVQVTEHQVDAPTRRINFTFVPHPEKDELILYGGEFFNGQKTFVYNDLFFYNIQSNSWTLIKAPAGPPPRCGHQMVATAANKGQLWLFGGEYASPTQSQFYHYRDLWVYHITNKQWQKITAPDGPSSRSGHRMVYNKKQLFVFGGFHDNLRDYKYFNDIHCFNTETYKWVKLQVSGIAPAPRSGCCMVALNDGKILLYGGYSKEKIKKDVDKGHVYTDSFLLTPDKNDTTGLKYKWVSTKLSGIHFSPRCSMPITTAPNNMAYCFGGVFDVEDDDENIAGNFYNDLIGLDMEKLAWRSVNLSGKRDKEAKSRRRKNNEAGDKDDMDAENEDEAVEVIQGKVEATTIADDGIFKVTIGPSSTSSQQCASNSQTAEGNTIFQPSARLNCGLAVKHGVLYLYGGMFEDGDKEITFSDFYSLDLKKCEEWKTIIKDNIKSAEWLGSDDSADEEDDDDEDDDDDDSDESMDTD